VREVATVGRPGWPRMLAPMAMDRHELERMNQLAARVFHLEQHLQFLYRHLGIEYKDPASLDDVGEALSRGNTLEAIKLYREKTGVGLAEAKAAVEDLARKLGIA
jgi:ribosomal protein L7/L12